MIIGGGIGGLCLAQGLRRAGIDVTVYERTLTRTDWLQGYRIHINPHGSRALHDCLDPANCVAALELPHDVVTATAPHVKNWHVKDFAFTRQAGWVGFNLVGCPLGEGLLDYDSIAEAVDPTANNINQIVEHWLPWQHDAETTCAMESEWTQRNINYLRSKS